MEEGGFSILSLRKTYLPQLSDGLRHIHYFMRLYSTLYFLYYEAIETINLIIDFILVTK